jgi:hypothetical protein
MATYLLESSSTLSLKEIENMATKTHEMHLGDRIGLLGVGVEKEMNVLHSLLKARDSVIDYAFQDTCISLYVCKQDLIEWKKLIEEQEFPEVNHHDGNDIELAINSSPNMSTSFSQKSSLNSQESRSSTTWRSYFFGIGDVSNALCNAQWPLPGKLTLLSELQRVY